MTSRWEKFSTDEHAQLAGMAFSLFQQGALIAIALWEWMHPYRSDLLYKHRTYA